MAVFGPLGPSDPALRIFRAGPEPPRAPKPEPPQQALGRLLAAATEAERAQHELASAKAVYQRAPSPERLQRLLTTAAAALEKECAFDTIWEEVSKDWFGHAHEAALL